VLRNSYQAFFILLMSVWLNPCWADAYDHLLLRAQASIYPKIVLLDQDLGSKLHNGSIVITIISSDQDMMMANEYREYMLEKYQNKLDGKKFIVNIATFDDLDKQPLSTAYIVMRGSEMLFKKVADYAASNARILFGYSRTSLDSDALISLQVKEKTYVYVGKNSVKKYGINFMPVFYKVVKIL